MNRFAFSLVELTVVLLIIGLILAIALKGQIIIESARLRSEVHKIEKLQSGFVNYVNRHDKRPPLADDGSYDAQALFDGGYLVQKETLAGIKSDGATAAFSWKYFPCLSNYVSEDNFTWSIPASNTNLLLANVCVATADNSSSTAMDGMLNCTIETSIDDKNYMGGGGRLDTGDTSDTSGIDFDDCSAASGAAVSYLYRIW
jgi:prepilin-type N-terminal cleavage/methylation domain-containing protein